MDNNSLILVFAVIQLMGINFYYNNIPKAKTKFEKGKIIFMGGVPLLAIVSLLINPVGL